jgi:choice-of-anchor C domain-containing protein
MSVLKVLVTGAVAALLSLPAAVGSANLVTNGSFESGPDPGVTMTLPVGSTVIAGWVVTGAPIEYVGTDWTAAQGARSVALNGSGPGGIAQTFDTLPHGQYNVRLYMAGDPGSSPVVKWLRVKAAGHSADFSIDITGMWAWDPGWDLRVFSFVADSISTTLEFSSLMSGDTGPTLDSVTVTLTSTAGVGVHAPGPALAIVGANPSSRGTQVAFTLDREGPARLRVLDVTGREVARLADETLPAGRHERSWSASAPAGVYFVELSAAGQRLTRRLVRLD